MSNRSKKSSVPEAQSALNRFKFEVASELGVPLSEGYRGFNFPSEWFRRRLYGKEND